MASTDYDIITIGGGLGGAALAKVMAEHGARVLVLESELNFKDRIRGEVMMSWRVADAKALGIYECMKTAGGVEVEYGEQSQDRGEPNRRHYPTSTIQETPRLNIYHPDLQEALLEAASGAGAVVRRGTRVQRVEPGDSPKVIATSNGNEQEFTSRLVVGADGRFSRTRGWGGFEVQKNPEQSFIAGILFNDMPMPENTSESFRVPDQGTTALLFPLGGGKVRAYLCYPTARGNQLSGAKDIQRFSELSVETGAPAIYYQDAVPAGPLASFSTASIWVESPFKDNVVLVGDAAGATDPTWGQGLSLTVRDVRVLRDNLLRFEDWNEAGQAYAQEHDKYFNVMNTVQSWIERLLIMTGSEAEARRAQAMPLWREDPSRRGDTFASGPDHPIDETFRRRFFGEE